MTIRPEQLEVVGQLVVVAVAVLVAAVGLVLADRQAPSHARASTRNGRAPVPTGGTRGRRRPAGPR